MCTTITNEDLFKIIQDGNEQIKSEIRDLRNQLNKEIDTLKSQNTELEKQNQELKNKVSNIEKKLKKYNVIVYGVDGSENETSIEVLKIINEKLHITCSINDFRDIYRIGQTIQGRIRPVVLEVLNYQLKLDILAKAKLNQNDLKKNKIYFAYDYTSEDYIKRKSLIGHLKAAREKNYKAFIRNNVLIVNGEEYTYEYLENNGQIAENSESPAKTVSSAPATPHSLLENVFNFPSQQIEDKKRKLEATPTKPKGPKQKTINTRSQIQKSTNHTD